MWLGIAFGSRLGNTWSVLALSDEIFELSADGASKGSDDVLSASGKSTSELVCGTLVLLL